MSGKPSWTAIDVILSVIILILFVCFNFLMVNFLVFSS